MIIFQAPFVWVPAFHVKSSPDFRGPYFQHVNMEIPGEAPDFQAEQQEQDKTKQPRIIKRSWVKKMCQEQRCVFFRIRVDQIDR